MVVNSNNNSRPTRRNILVVLSCNDDSYRVNVHPWCRQRFLDLPKQLVSNLERIHPRKVNGEDSENEANAILLTMSIIIATGIILTRILQRKHSLKVHVPGAGRQAFNECLSLIWPIISNKQIATAGECGAIETVGGEQARRSCELLLRFLSSIFTKA